MAIIDKKIVILVLALVVINLAAWGGFSYNAYVQNQNLRNMSERIKSLEISPQGTSQSGISKDQFDALVERTREYGQKIDGLLKGYADLQNKSLEVVRQEITKQKSQDQILTEAVAKITPAVASIVITKDVPKLEVVYVNPFGDDPFFNDVNVRVPRYIQKGTEEKKVGAGTGFLISSSGFIATNRHVVDDPAAKYTVLLSDGTQKEASIIYIDDKVDFAIIKVEGASYKYVNLGDSSAIKLGQAVFAVGNALGEYNNSVSTGIISGLNRNIQASDSSGTETLTGVIQTDAPINPGNSGGPLVTLDGDVIGINVATVVGSNNISFSIPVNMIKDKISAVAK